MLEGESWPARAWQRLTWFAEEHFFRTRSRRG